MWRELERGGDLGRLPEGADAVSVGAFALQPERVLAQDRLRGREGGHGVTVGLGPGRGRRADGRGATPIG